MSRRSDRAARNWTNWEWYILLPVVQRTYTRDRYDGLGFRVFRKTYVR